MTTTGEAVESAIRLGSARVSAVVFSVLDLESMIGRVFPPSEEVAP